MSPFTQSRKAGEDVGMLGWVQIGRARGNENGTDTVETSVEAERENSSSRSINAYNPKNLILLLYFRLGQHKLPTKHEIFSPGTLQFEAVPQPIALEGNNHVYTSLFSQNNSISQGMVNCSFQFLWASNDISHGKGKSGPCRIVGYVWVVPRVRTISSRALVEHQF